LAEAVQYDDEADPEQALEHYRKALKLDPDQPRRLSDYGLLAVSLGQTAEGLPALRSAVELAPDDRYCLGQLVEGLCELNRDEEAKSVLLAALFRNSRDPRFHRLWRDFQFQQLHKKQVTAQEQKMLAAMDSQQPVLLPFEPTDPTEPTKSPPGKRLRPDRASRPAPPHRPARLPTTKPA
jgi:tetratricopeptide (TPR) repeat protein